MVVCPGHGQSRYLGCQLLHPHHLNKNELSSCCSQNHSLFSLSKLNDQFRIIFWTVCLLYEPNFHSYMFLNRIYNNMISISLILS